MQAVKTCINGDNGRLCGLRWTEGAVPAGFGDHGQFIGVGEQMAVLEIIQSNLVDRSPKWVSAVEGTGTSVGDVNAGTGDRKIEVEESFHTNIGTGDRVGAGILTALMLIGVLGGCGTMIMSE